jgi:hypothetical protein
MALHQLYAYGASDVWYMTTKADAVPYNMPAYNSCSFLECADDTDGTIDITYDTPILQQTDIGFPFSVKKEKAICHIQRSWRKAISNPNYKLCRDRLLRDHSEVY